jgi:hypothetical protein
VTAKYVLENFLCNGCAFKIKTKQKKEKVTNQSSRMIINISTFIIHKKFHYGQTLIPE